MRKKPVFLVLAMLLFTGIAAGEIYYSIDADEDSLKMNSTVKMSCDSIEGNCPVNTWTLTLNKPENSAVVDIESSIGEVNQYDIEGNKLTVETTSEEPTESVKIRVNYRISTEAEKVAEGLYHRQIGLPGFRGERNYGRINADDLIHADISYGFKSSLQNDEFRFTGSGPANTDLNFGDGYETKYFEFFGGEPENTEKAYEISAGILGFHHRFDTLPVVIRDNREYNKTVNQWSRGQYIRGRLVLREDLEDDFLPILAHEVVHAFNDEPLEWDQTDSSYFDEGTAKYVESMVRRTEVDHTERQLFGDDISYTRERDGKRYRYTLPSKGDRDQLWQYYQDDLDFMKSWSAENENRAFGYAYSELIIRNYIANQDGSIRELYSEIGNQEKITSPEAKWSYYSERLDMTPCRYDSREKFENCLDEINEYEYKVYRAEPRERSADNLGIEEINISEPEIDENENDDQTSDQDITKKGYNNTSDFDREDITEMNRKTDNSGNQTSNRFFERISQSIQKWVSYFFHT